MSDLPKPVVNAPAEENTAENTAVNVTDNAADVNTQQVCAFFYHYILLVVHGRICDVPGCRLKIFFSILRVFDRFK